MANAVIYARYSSHNQRDASIEDQVRECTAAAEKANDKIISVYADRARSGTEATRRQEFLKMIDDAQKKRFVKVYVYKLDRFARNRDDASRYRMRLRASGVKVVSATEPISSDPHGVLVESMLEGMAEYYSLNLSQQVRRGLEGNALKCMHNGIQLYGYDLGSDGHYHINEDEARIVRLVFESYDSGKSSGEIVKALEPYRTRSGKRWHKSHVCRMLKNEKYAGTYIFGDHYVPDGMEAIVSKEIYDRVNSRLGKTYSRNHDYALSGILYDHEGRRYAGVCGTNHDGKRYHYYKVMETKETYPQSAVEGSVYEAVGALLDSSDDFVDKLADVVVSARDEMLAQNYEKQDALKRSIDRLDREADNLVRTIGKIGPEDRLLKRLTEIDEERQGLMDELVTEEDTSPRFTKKSVVALLTLIKMAEAPFSVVSKFVDRVILHDNKISTFFNITADDIAFAELDPSIYDIERKKRPEPNEDEIPALGPNRLVRTGTVWLPRWDGIRTIPVVIGPSWFAILSSINAALRTRQKESPHPKAGALK